MGPLKQCAVCPNNNRNNPILIFVQMPHPKKETRSRRAWFDVYKGILNYHENLDCYLCSDHFNLEEDASNLEYYTTNRMRKLLFRPHTLPRPIESNSSDNNEIKAEPNDLDYEDNYILPDFQDSSNDDLRHIKGEPLDEIREEPIDIKDEPIDEEMDPKLPALTPIVTKPVVINTIKVANEEVKMQLQMLAAQGRLRMVSVSNPNDPNATATLAIVNPEIPMNNNAGNQRMISVKSTKPPTTSQPHPPPPPPPASHVQIWPSTRPTQGATLVPLAPKGGGPMRSVFACCHCTELFYTIPERNVHIQAKHGIGGAVPQFRYPTQPPTPVFKCEICGNYIALAKKADHMSSHETFKCVICHQTLEKGIYANHMLSHREEPPDMPPKKLKKLASKTALLTKELSKPLNNVKMIANLNEKLALVRNRKQYPNSTSVNSKSSKAEHQNIIPPKKRSVFNESSEKSAQDIIQDSILANNNAVSVYSVPKKMPEANEIKRKRVDAICNAANEGAHRPAIEHESPMIEKQIRSTFVCKVCGEVFASIALFVNHQRLEHSAVQVITSHTPKTQSIPTTTTTSSQPTVSIHNSQLTTNTSSSSSSSSSSSKVTAPVNSAAEGAVIRCPYCPTPTLLQPHLFTTHMRTKHPMGPPSSKLRSPWQPFRCDICNLKFRNSSDVNQHKTLVHSKAASQTESVEEVQPQTKRMRRTSGSETNAMAEDEGEAEEEERIVVHVMDDEEEEVDPLMDVNAGNEEFEQVDDDSPEYVNITMFG